MNFFEYIASLTRLIVWYLSKLCVPHGIFLTWTTSVIKNYILLWWMTAIVLLISGIFLMIRWKNRPAALGIFWITSGFLPLAAACLVQPPRGIMIEPFWLIFVSIGFFIVIADILTGIFQAGRQKIAWISGAFIVFLWIGLTWQSNALWSSEEKYCLTWLKEAPQCSPADCHLARVYSARGNFAKARFYQEACRTGSPGDEFNYYYRMGMMDFREQKWEEAAKKFLQALRIYPDEASVLTSLGALAYRNQDMELAKEYFMKAVASDQFNIFSRLNLATMALKKGQKEEALKFYNEVLAIKPNDEAALTALIKFYWNEKNKDECIKIGRRLSKASFDPQILTNAGVILNFYGLKEEAMQNFSRSIEQSPRFQGAYIEMGKIFYKENKKTQAEELFRKAAQLGPIE